MHKTSPCGPFGWPVGGGEQGSCRWARVVSCLVFVSRMVVRSGRGKDAPIGHNALALSFSGSERKGDEIAYLAGLPHHGSPLVLSYIIPQLWSDINPKQHA